MEIEKCNYFSIFKHVRRYRLCKEQGNKVESTDSQYPKVMIESYICPMQTMLNVKCFYYNYEC